MYPASCSMFTLVTWKLSTWLLDLAHIPAGTTARIARQKWHSGTQTDVTDNSDEFRAPTFVEDYLQKEDWDQAIFKCLNPTFLNSNLPILLLCPPPLLYLKLGIVKLRMQQLFSLHPHFEKEVAKTLGLVQEDFHGKSFEGRQCS